MNKNTSKSEQLFPEAQSLIPGGVNSPVRAFKSVGGVPLFMKKGEAAYIWDVDGNRYLDCVCSWGPLILGHARAEVVQAACEAVRLGASFGAPTELEVELARGIVEAVPSIEMVRLVNSGTEAVMTAIRLARGFTKRFKVVKFEGAYHGHSDGLLVKAGSGMATLSLPDSPGVPPSYAAETLLAPYNDLDAVKKLLSSQGYEIAAVIVEPVAGNMGVVAPAPGFLQGLRNLTREVGALLIFDEVITGFRVDYGGAQTIYGVMPDLTVLGKIIGGGFPIGAFGGRREIMEMLAPSGPIYQAGTLSGNPPACAAGLAALRLLAAENPYSYLERLGQLLSAGLTKATAKANIPATVNQVGAMITLFFTPGPVTDWTSAAASNREQYAAFFHAMLDQGVYLPPAQFEAIMLSSAHIEEDIEFICRAAEAAFTSFA